MVSINYRFNSDISQDEKNRLRTYLNKKIEKWGRLFKKSEFPPRVNVEVEFLPKKKRYRVEMQLDSSIGKVIGACERQNMQEGADEVLEEVRCQFHKQKDKVLTLRRRAGMSVKKLFSVHKTARFRLPRIAMVRGLPGWLRDKFGKK